MTHRLSWHKVWLLDGLLHITAVLTQARHKIIVRVTLGRLYHKCGTYKPIWFLDARVPDGCVMRS